MFAKWLHTMSNESLRKILTKTNKLTKELFTVFRLGVLLCLASSLQQKNSPLSRVGWFLVALSTLFVSLGFCATHKQNTYSGFMSFFSFCLSSLWLFTVNFNLTATSDLAKAFFEILSDPGLYFISGSFIVLRYYLHKLNWILYAPVSAYVVVKLSCSFLYLNYLKLGSTSRKIKLFPFLWSKIKRAFNC